MTSPLEHKLHQILRNSKEHSLSVHNILETLSGKGKPIILIFLSLPFCQPLQIPGLSTPFGILIAIISIRMCFSNKIWAPKFILKKKISSKFLQKFIPKALWLVKKIKPFFHSRLTVLCTYPPLKYLNGFLIALWGLFLALPLPIPLTNIIAAWAIFLMSLGLLEEDGLLILLSYLVIVACAIVITFIVK